jgi:hypothetical protein
MSVTLWAALLCEAVSIALLRHRLGKLWLRRPVVLLVLVSVACQGLPAVLLSFPSIAQWDTFRAGTAPGYIAVSALIASAAMLAFTVAYLLTQPQRAQPPEPDVRVIARILDWRILALACLPLAVLTYQGKGYASVLASSPGTVNGTVLAETFFPFLLALASAGFVLRHGRFLPALAAQSVFLAAAGQRAPVAAAAVALVVVLCHAGKRPARRDLHAAAVMAVVLGLAITGVRAEQGRGLFNGPSGLSARVSALAGGLSGLSAGAGPPLIAQAASRLDDDSFAGGILQAVSLGHPRLSPAGVPESVLLVVPSAVWPSKLAGSLTSLDPAVAETRAFGLQPVNFLPGLPGLYMGFLAWPWLIVLLGGLGAVAGKGERWLLREMTPARFTLLAGAVLAVPRYEAGLPAILVTLRYAAAAAVVVFVAERLRSGDAADGRVPGPARTAGTRARRAASASAAVAGGTPPGRARRTGA